MSGTPLLLVGLAGIFVALTVLLGTIGALTSERQQVGRSLAAVRAMSGPSNPSIQQEAQPPFADRVVTPLLQRMSQTGRRFSPAGQAEKLRSRLEAAGSPAGWDVDRVIAFKVLGMFAFGLVGLALTVVAGGGPAPVLGITAVAAATGYFAPNMWLYQLGYDRAEQIQKDLPDALDLLTISVEAGLGFDAALAQVARNTEGPVADEFFRVLQEMQIGLGRSEAFRALNDRTDVGDLRSFTSAMVQADVFGIPIANVLRVQSKEMRVKRTQRAEEQAQKVPVKILFPLIFCILPALFVIIIGPAGISIFRNF